MTWIEWQTDGGLLVNESRSLDKLFTMKILVMLDNSRHSLFSPTKHRRYPHLTGRKTSVRLRKLSTFHDDRIHVSHDKCEIRWDDHNLCTGRVGRDPLSSTRSRDNRNRRTCYSCHACNEEKRSGTSREPWGRYGIWRFSWPPINSEEPRNTIRLFLHYECIMIKFDFQTTITMYQRTW
jgi:hypothetical protein